MRSPIVLLVLILLMLIPLAVFTLPPVVLPDVPEVRSDDLFWIGRQVGVGVGIVVLVGGIIVALRALTRILTQTKVPKRLSYTAQDAKVFMHTSSSSTHEANARVIAELASQGHDLGAFTGAPTVRPNAILGHLNASHMPMTAEALQQSVGGSVPEVLSVLRDLERRGAVARVGNAWKLVL